MSRTGFNGRPRLIFVFVIIKAFNRSNFDYRQRLSVNHSHGKLPSVNKLFHKGLFIVLKRLFKSTLVIFLCLCNAASHAGTAAACFHNAWKRNFRTGFPMPFVVLFLNAHTLWRRDSVADKQFLGKTLIHSQGRAYIIRPGISDSHKVEARLNLSVFPVFPMERKKHHVRRLADSYNVRSEKVLFPVRAQGLYLLDIRIFLGNGSDIFCPVSPGSKNLGGICVVFPFCLSVSQIHVQKNGVMPLFLKRPVNHYAGT